MDIKIPLVIFVLTIFTVCVTYILTLLVEALLNSISRLYGELYHRLKGMPLEPLIGLLIFIFLILLVLLGYVGFAMWVLPFLRN